MSRGRSAPNHLLVNALSIVAHAQPELPRVETDLQRNLPSRSVAIGIAHSFVGDPIHLRRTIGFSGRGVPSMTISTGVRFAPSAANSSPMAVRTGRGHRLRRTVAGPVRRCERPWWPPQPAATLSESLLGLQGLVGKESQRPVEQEQDSLKILQQCVVEITRDAGSLGERASKVSSSRRPSCRRRNCQAPHSIPQAARRTARETSSSGTSPAQWRNPAPRPPRSRPRCCWRRPRGTDRAAAAGWCRTPGADSRPPANRGLPSSL